MAPSRLDTIARAAQRAVPMLQFFRLGWGDPAQMESLRRVAAEQFKSHRAMSSIPQPEITLSKKRKGAVATVYEGRFLSPLSLLYPSLMSPECAEAIFELVVPNKGADHCCIHLAGTGDHFFWRRRQFLALPLASQGISSVILENPYYGPRRPPQQRRSRLLRVSDLMIMGASLAMEAEAIFAWLTEQGYSRLGISGVSLGGHMASLAACVSPRQVALIPCLSSQRSAHVFTDGIYGEKVAWDILQEQIEEGRECVRTFLGPERASEVTQTKAYDLLTFLLDETTDLKNYPMPQCPSACEVVYAPEDGYIPATDSRKLLELWKGCSGQEVSGGHISTSLLGTQAIRKAILQSFDRLDTALAPNDRPRSNDAQQRAI
eukprot:m.176457 g.176457  ORF g.176457 m.176457 type:complete len:376 (+) comp10430_c0_seq5:2710-3837(+)